jgi:pilus assembly protein Flp/PilA
MRLLYRLIRERTGATAMEYGLIAALVSVMTIASLQALGEGASTMFGTVAAVVDVADDL